MDLFEALETTRSVRRFSDAPVTDDEIVTCVRAATVHGRAKARERVPAAKRGGAERRRREKAA